MMLLSLFVIAAFAAALYHSSSIAQQHIKEAEQAKADLAKLRSQYDDLADAYRVALATIKELKAEVDHEPEYC